jgi:hypothetical protein
MHCKVTCILYKKQAHFSRLFCLQIWSVTPWWLHDRKSRCLRGFASSSNSIVFISRHDLWHHLSQSSQARALWPIFLAAFLRTPHGYLGGLGPGLGLISLSSNNNIKCRLLWHLIGWRFFSAETTMHCKVTCILYKKQAHFSQLFCLQVRSVTPWQLHDRKSRCLRGRRHSSKVNTILKVVKFQTFCYFI